MNNRLWLAGFLLLWLAAPPLQADWDPGATAKWIQLPDLDITGIDVNDSPFPRDYILADDFLCQEEGPLTDIHIWGSWVQDMLPQNDPGMVEFQIGIYSDIPASENPDGYSIPGQLLWERVFPVGAVSLKPNVEGIAEGWLDAPDLYLPPPADTVCWQYNFTIPEPEAFYQLGNPNEPVVYWLCVKAFPMGDGTQRFGWKTSVDHWNDDAVWGEGPAPMPGLWWELRYPQGHPWPGESIDLAFVLDGPEIPEEYDFGDAPDPTYPTLAAGNGPMHLLSPLYLGNLIDGEPDGQPDPTATGDDNNGLPDEDGVVFTSTLVPGQPATVDVTCSGGGMLDAWVDFDLSGSWEPTEQIFASLPLPAGLNSLSFMVPPGSVQNTFTFARFRFSTGGNLGPSGPYPTGGIPDGEVEDHRVFIEMQHAYKWWQRPDLMPTGIDVNCSPIHGTPGYILADDFLCTSPGLLTEITIFGSWLYDYLPFGQDPLAMDFILSIHKDIPADQNPDGYSMPGEELWEWGFPAASFRAEPLVVDIVEGWMNPPDEYIFPADYTCWEYTFTIDPTVAFRQTGTEANPVVYWLDVKAFPHDPEAYFGWKSSLDHWNDDAVWGIGQEPFPGPWYELIYPPQHEFHPESMDLAFRILGTEIPEELDFGDAPDTGYRTLLASNGPRHLIVPGFHLGALIDGEPDGQPNAAATGDDLANLDDEDGVVFTSVLKPGQTATVDVTASAAGMLDAWFDFNANGSFDATERIFGSQPLIAGLNTLSFTVPAWASELTVTFSRFRFSSMGGLGPDGILPTGAVPDGEVEDHQEFIDDRFVFKWIQHPDLSPFGIDVNASVDEAGNTYVLADDFLCTTTGPVTDIHVWGSWLHDYLPFGQDPRAVEFTLSFHADIPADQSPTGYSMPGEVLWVRTFDPVHFNVERFAGDIEEGWMDPPDRYVFPADWTCWLYKFHVDPHLAFIQEGTENEAVVYWLDVQARPLDPMAHFGWKTTMDHWNDDAVWGLGAEPYPGPWGELVYPPQHELFGQSIDLAFALYEDLITPAPEIPLKTGLLHNAPNPFNPATVIHFVMPPEGGTVKLEVFDLQGRLVKVLLDGFTGGGERTATWNGRNTDGAMMPSGVYLYRLRGAGIDQSLKMLLLR
ncbi:T9SS type A sorting domain-containing protein [bacterium]|nr:T9SS type A sorting domain-containing protein [bacterium]